MARKGKSKKNKGKHSVTPAVRHLRFQLTNSGVADTETSHFIDLARSASLVNRRLYEQGRHYYVKKMTVTSRDTPTGLVSVGAAPNSWVVEQAWKKAKNLWKAMREGHGGAPGSGLPEGITAPTWADFKVFLSNDHRTATEPLPLDNGNNAARTTDSEWEHATLVSPDGTTSGDQFHLHLLGATVTAGAGNLTSAGIVQGYQESRRTIQRDRTGDEIDPDSWMINLFDDGTTLDEVVVLIEAEGNLPPYDQSEYPGCDANMPKPMVLSGFEAPLGLLEIEIQSSVPNDVYDVLIELAPGRYKGVKALPL
ncbi:hypothetical protein ES703_80540 [subsurface metagenome]